MAPENTSVICVKPPVRSELLTLRILILFGFIAIVSFLWWFFTEERMGYAPLYWPLTIILLFKMIRSLHEWYYYLHVSIPQKPVLTKSYRVDILTTACPGEPQEMIINTLRAMQVIRYPHTSYLCDEGDDPVLKKVCDELGVIHVTRKEKINAKAGNINNALKQATGEICIILDPDHVPVPEFIDRVLPYFENPEIGFVQSVQAYSNRKESLIALGACEQTYHFYGPMMMSMNSYGVAQAIGANCAFRRKALDSIGGHAPGLAEDMHTSMLLHAKGWKSVYIPEILTRGLVPSSLPAYFKQQLKWSRGTFDLFFGVLPKIFKKLTWRQRIHYSTIPLYFFYGVVDFLNILIPILCLLLAEFAWQVDLVDFFKMSLPIVIMTILIRQYSQKWLLEKHERGFHLVGGLLRIGTWWIFSLGFIYTLLKIKVPYIPTPKDGEPENSVKLCIPNIIACIISLAAIVYGLKIDWSPYSFFMASLALVNVCILGYITIIGQQKMLLTLYSRIQASSINQYIYPARLWWWNFRHSIYLLIRSYSPIVASLLIITISLFLYKNEEEYSYFFNDKKRVVNTGGKYAGIQFTSFENKKPDIPAGEIPFDIYSFGQEYNLMDLINFSSDELRFIALRGKIPMITLAPLKIKDDLFPAAKDENDILLKISSGEYDYMLKEISEHVREIEWPIFVNLMPLQNSSNKIIAHQYIYAWQHIVSFFKMQGVSNLVWIYEPVDPNDFTRFFPGENYIDWISLNMKLNDPQGKNGKGIILQYRNLLDNLKLSYLPIMITGLTKNSSQDLRTIAANTPEIKAFIFSDAAEGNKYIEIENITQGNYIRILKTDYSTTTKTDSSVKNIVSNRKKFIKGTPGKFDLIVNDKPFYIKGVTYNSPYFLNHEHLPLTRSQLKKDFELIKAMGANTIRRYHPGIYDKNVLQIADEYELKVIYGFWIDPDIDFLTDTIRQNEYLLEVERTVTDFKEYNSVLGWSLGNDTYSALKYYFHKPYLNKVRNTYILFIEKLAQRIHQLDPGRPVIAILSHNDELPSAVHEFKKYAPSVDIMGINSHNKDDLKKLKSIMEKFDPSRPYIVSEFSAGGYWEKESLNDKGTLLLEKSDHEKANDYFWNWIKYVNFEKGYNLGGIAYNWRDKPEGTATWFGLTDLKGRLKPSYYKLKKVWTNEGASIPLPWIYITGNSKEICPSEEYTFSIVQEYPGDFTYEWYLQTENEMNYVGKLTQLGKGESVTVRIPEGENKLRLYVYLSDDNGNVVTSSMPLEINKLQLNTSLPFAK